MLGISPDLIEHLRQLLLRCDQLESNEALRSLFVEERLRPWRNRLPTDDQIAIRVDLVIDFLGTRFDRDKQNALVLLLLALKDRTPPEDLLHRELEEAAGRLARELDHDLLNLEQEITYLLPEDDPRRQEVAQLIERLRHHNELLREWKQLHKYLDGLTNITYGQFTAQLRRFQERPLDLELIKGAWAPVYHHVQRLLGWSEGIAHIAPAYRVVDGQKRGAEWAVKLGSQVELIQKHLANTPPPAPEPAGGWRGVLGRLGGDEAAEDRWRSWWLPKLIDLSDELEHEMRLQMSEADENLREAAADLYNLSQQVLWSEKQ